MLDLRERIEDVAAEARFDKRFKNLSEFTSVDLLSGESGK
jgi:hypothetical protein